MDWHAEADFSEVKEKNLVIKIEGLWLQLHLQYCTLATTTRKPLHWLKLLQTEYTVKTVKI